MNKIKLSKAIEAHGRQITEIEIKEPNAGDIIALGTVIENGFAKDGSMVIRSNMSVVGAYLERLCNIPPSSVRSMAAGDFMACSEVLTDFFANAQKTSVES